jgi:rhodanese-related sulfurtransferase
VRSVDVAGLKAAIDGGAVKRLVDVRTAEEFAGGHVLGAINVPVDALEARLGELGPPGEVHVICQSGGRSARAAQTLAAKGFVAVNVTGGTGAWKAAGYAVETP